MKIELSRGPDQYKELFRALKQPEDVADLLEVSYPALNYWIYRTPEFRRYSTFYIAKKSGKLRKIDAPNTNIKILQQKLNQVLQSVYSPKPSVHGFVVGRSVKSNAQQHVGKRWVFNVDLEDFFPSINFGRVRGMFMGKPYCLPPRVATVLAHLCCFQRHLPQGGPTSPVVSNMICAQMDSQLQTLAKKNRSTYTRYVDDITFSTTSPTLPSEIVVFNRLNQLSPGVKLKETIEGNGFCINDRKVWLSGQNRRQVVTGVTVNKITNLPKRFTSQIRAMLHAWETYGLSAAEKEWRTKYFAGHYAPWRSRPSFAEVLKGKIEYLGMIKGQESWTYLRFLDDLRELDSNLVGQRGTRLRLIRQAFEELEWESATPQTRGYSLEDIINELFNISNIPVTKSFRRNAGGEQIDGAFELETRPFLVECKWRTKPSSQAEVDALLGKVNRSGSPTMGLFISVNGWSGNVGHLTKQNPDKKVLLMDGEDIRAVLSANIPLDDMIHKKVDALTFKSEPFISAAEILQRINS